MELNHLPVLKSFVLALSISLITACQPNQTSNQPAVQPIVNPTAKPTVTPSTAPTAKPSESVPPTSLPSASSSPTPSASAPTTGGSLPANLASLKIVASRVSFFEVGQQTQLSVTLLDAAGQPISATVPATWISSKPEQFSVDGNGLVTALLANGLAEITVSIPGTEFKATLNVSFVKSSGGGGGGGAGNGTTNTESLDAEVSFQGLGLGEFQVNTYTSDSQSAARIAAGHDGEFIVAWNSTGQDGSSTGVFAQRFDAQGLPLGEEFQVNTYTTGIQSNVDIAADEQGNFIITWTSTDQDGSTRGIYAQHYNADGNSLGAEFRVNTFTNNSQAAPYVAMDTDGDFVVTWHSQNQDGDDYGIYAQRYNSQGVVQDSEFRVNTYTTGHQSNARIAMSDDGQFVIAWSSLDQDGDNFGVYAQRYNSVAVAQGSEFQVNTYTSNRQNTAAIAMDADGDFVISWQGAGQEGSNYGIFAQRYNSIGVEQGSEFLVNTYTTGQQKSVNIAMDSEGDFIVAWHSDGHDGSSYGAYAQRYTSGGVANGTEFRVNTYTTSTQSSPQTAFDADGDFVIVWNDSSGQDGNSTGIFAQLFNNQGQFQ